jgi:arsenate reductase-like glutaredoxin family protein
VPIVIFLVQIKNIEFDKSKPTKGELRKIKNSSNNTSLRITRKRNKFSVNTSTMKNEVLKSSISKSGVEGNLSAIQR